MKIIINRDWGGFKISNYAYSYIRVQQGSKEDTPNNLRINSQLIGLLEGLGNKAIAGKKADGTPSNLQIYEIPDNVYWEIINDNGMERLIYSESCLQQKPQ
jgi:hypothetical protein